MFEQPEVQVYVALDSMYMSAPFGAEFEVNSTSFNDKTDDPST